MGVLWCRHRPLRSPARSCRIRLRKESGLPKPSLLCMKFITIDRSIVDKRIGRLPEAEQADVRNLLGEFFL